MADILHGRKRFLFDLDGTLVDSSSAHAAAFRSALATCSVDLARDFDYAAEKGRKTRDVFLRRGLDENRAASLTVLKQRLYREQVEAGAVQPFPGARDLLEWLVRQRRTCGLVTGAGRRNAEALLQRFDLHRYFDRLVCGDDVMLGKPHPDIYLLAVRAGTNPVAECLAIEDSVGGVQAARAAGLAVVGVHDPDAGSAADLHCADLADLLGRLRRQRGPS